MFKGEINVVCKLQPINDLLALVIFSCRTFIYSLCIKGGKPTPFLPLIVAFLFCSINGYLQSRTHAHYHQYDSNELLSRRFITGATLFITGMVINVHSDSILRNLRKPGEKGYKIPKGIGNLNMFDCYAVKLTYSGHLGT